MYSATVTSTIAETDVTVGDNIIITIIASPLVAHIRGASQRKVGPDDMIELDGSLSSDPDEPEGKNISTLQFEWTCLKVCNLTCFFESYYRCDSILSTYKMNTL